MRELQALLAEPPGAAPDLHVACVTALGLVPLRELPGLPYEAHRPGRLVSDRKKQVALLLDVLADPGRDALVRAHVPRALALLGEDASRGLRDLVKQALLEELERGGWRGNASTRDRRGPGRAGRRGRRRRGRGRARGCASASGAERSSSAGRRWSRWASRRAGWARARRTAALPETRSELVQQALHGRPRLRPWAALALGVQSWHARAPARRSTTRW
ncbi:MAG: hypothetical protein H6828_02380 [Planctomycetes bacterium]|nr:hypothetical protein [Planctomycetota bacterium]